MLERHPWPGNICELRNVIDRAVLLCGGARTRERAAPGPPPPTMTPPPPRRRPSTGRRAPTSGPALQSSSSLEDDLERVERERILQALEQ